MKGSDPVPTNSSQALVSRFRAWVDWWRAARAGVTLGDGLARRADNFLLLRMLAAAMVVYGHAPHLAPAVHRVDFFVRKGWGHYSGDIAVDAFFLISGFLVTGSWLRQKSFYRFIKARFLRVVPAFFLNVTLLALVFGAAFTTLNLHDYYAASGTWHYIAQNLKYSPAMAWTLPGVFEHGMKASTINGAQWTLPAEVRMYVLLGALAATGLLRSARATAVAGAALLLGGWLHPEWFPLLPDWFRLGGFFAIGVLAYQYRNEIRLTLGGVVALVLLAVLTCHLPTYAVTFPLALAAVVFALAYLTPPLTWLDRHGDPSYGIYLWGWPSQQVVAWALPGAGLLEHVALALLLACLLGYASWHGVERWALRLK